jgi:phosphotransferase system enzyme I (PtsP)
VPGAPGICLGTAVVIHPTAILESVPDREADDVTVELLVFDRAITTVRDDILDIRKQLAQSLPPEELALFDAYLHMLDDAAIVVMCVRASGRGRAQGARQVIMEHVRNFERMEDSYLSERGADVKNWPACACVSAGHPSEKVTRGLTVLIGEEVTPAMIGKSRRKTQGHRVAAGRAARMSRSSRVRSTYRP